MRHTTIYVVFQSFAPKRCFSRETKINFTLSDEKASFAFFHLCGFHKYFLCFLSPPKTTLNFNFSFNFSFDCNFKSTHNIFFCFLWFFYCWIMCTLASSENVKNKYTAAVITATTNRTAILNLASQSFSNRLTEKELENVWMRIKNARTL